MSQKHKDPGWEQNSGNCMEITWIAWGFCFLLLCFALFVLLLLLLPFCSFFYSRICKLWPMCLWALGRPRFSHSSQAKNEFYIVKRLKNPKKNIWGHRKTMKSKFQCPTINLIHSIKLLSTHCALLWDVTACKSAVGYLVILGIPLTVVTPWGQRPCFALLSFIVHSHH